MLDTFQRCFRGLKSCMEVSGSQSCSSDNKMIVLHDEDTLLHETVELLGAKLKPALESPARIKAIVSTIKQSDKHELLQITASSEDQDRALELAKVTHDHEYLDHIRNVFQKWLEAGLVEPTESVLPECFRLHNNAVTTLKPPKDIYARAGYYAFDMSTGITRDSWRSIIASANLAIRAADLLTSHFSSEDSPSGSNQLEHATPKSILALCRPPGHHCTGEQAGGYCYINNIAVSISTIRENLTQASHLHPTSPPKFAILDLDFHHGNGTQEIFYHDPNVLYISLHGQDEFPYYIGSPSERGPENTPAYNTNLNFPLPVGTSATEYLATLTRALTSLTNYKPDFLLLSLGFDTFHLDPLGSFDIRTENYAEIAHLVRSTVMDVPALIVFEGGYVVERLGENLLAFLEGWVGAEDGAAVGGIAG